ncbi:MAG: class I SAM-dependent methyltransferase [Acidobacteriota bacterium]|nr:class I SAM-dependent methyltransferase [Acidobacteriota bacterium]
MTVGADRVAAVVWHDLECGRYRQDLSLWLELAAARVPAGGAVLDVGAGTGRVTLTLARAGHRVVALDREAELLRELAQRAGGLPVETVRADARDFRLDRRRFELIVAPMQTLQLLGGAAGHAAFFRCARAHLARGGVVAVAIAAAEDFEEYEWQEGDRLPLPDIAELDGRAYFSQPTAVRRVGDTYVLQRRRETVEPDGARSSSEDRIALDILTAESVERAAAEAGLRPRARRRVGATDEHIGSEVLVLGV